jgi:flavin reductase (DIM6/NTAB) family NADH-FMN oxidoreductase RutF
VHVDTEGLGAAESYRLTIACLVPRPVAWVSTLGADGKANLAPFSFFGGISSAPPVVMVAVGRTRGRRKDTATNLLANGEAVVHVPTRPLAERMVASSARTPPDADDFALVGLAKVASDRVAPWRIAEAPVAMETVLLRHEEIGGGPTDVFFLRVLRFHVADDVVRDGVPDPSLLRAVGRLGGELYAEVDDPFRIPRPE